MSYLCIGTLFSKFEIFFAMFFDFIPKATEASFHTVLKSYPIFPAENNVALLISSFMLLNYALKNKNAVVRFPGENHLTELQTKHKFHTWRKYFASGSYFCVPYILAQREDLLAERRARSMNNGKCEPSFFC